MTKAKFARELHGGETGPDVEGVARALARAGFLDGLPKLMSKTPGFRRTYNASKQRAVNHARAKIKLVQTGVYDRKVHEYLERLDAFDAYAAKLMEDYRPAPTLCFPIAGPDVKVTVGGLHETGGLPGNWARDFLCKPGSGIVAPERATVTRFSGTDPALGRPNAIGVYGWTTYLQTPVGYMWFLTHQGRRLPTLKIGQRVEAGDLLGFVGHQQPLTGRPDHLHAGVSSPKGPADAKKHITAVSKAPRAS